MVRTCLRFITILSLVLSLCVGTFSTAYAFSFQDVLSTGVEIAFAKKEFNYYNSKGRDKMLDQYKKEVGVSDDSDANDMLNRITGNLVPTVNSLEGISTPYSFFVNPKKDINAFCGIGHNISVNKGTFDKFNYNEDEIAFILAHEMGHGQGNHLTNRFNKTITLSIAAKLYTEKNDNTLSYLLSGLSMRRIIAKGFTLPNEWDADNRSFTYAVNAGYNPGAGAAAFVRMRAFYGDQTQNFFGELLSPNDHPTTPQRIENYAKKLTNYSKNHIKVVGNTIYIDNNQFMSAAKTENEYAEERAFIIAGRLACIYNDLPTISNAYTDNGAVKIDQYTIVEPTENDESAETLAARLNEVMCLY